MAYGDFFRIHSNIGAFNALSALRAVTRAQAATQVRLATGRRINEVADDPAGFVIARRLEARTRGLAAALDNVGTAKNLLATAEGGLQNISEILLTVKEKVTQAASDTLSSAERTAIRTEITQLTSEIDDVVEETTFNRRKLIDGTFSGVRFQTGAAPGNVLRVDLNRNNNATGLNIASSAVANRVLTATGAGSALTSVDTAIERVSDSLQQVGALVGRLSVKESTLSTGIINNTATKSRIEDADLAREQLRATQLSILMQTATAQLAQANVLPASVLFLVRNRR